MMQSKFDRLPAMAAIVAVAIAVAACVIKLRGDEALPQSATPIAQRSDQSGELERCRRVTYEEKDMLGECRKTWAEKRRQFLGRQGGSSAFPDEGLAKPGLPASTPSQDDRRQPAHQIRERE